MNGRKEGRKLGSEPGRGWRDKGERKGKKRLRFICTHYIKSYPH